MGIFAKKENSKKGLWMKRIKRLALFFAPFSIFISVSCASKPQTSILLNDIRNPSQNVQEVLAKEGKSDYFLLRDEGYSLRMIYLCPNRVYNFVEGSNKNHILVSLQPLLDSKVEKKLSPEDRLRIWACWERKVREEQSQVEERKKRIIEARIQLAKEVDEALNERNRIVAEIEFKKKLAEQRRRQMEEERRRMEEERRRMEEERRRMEENLLRKIEEEQRRKIEEERKIQTYKAGEREKEVLSPLPPPITQSGIFLVMSDASVHEAARNNSRIKGHIRKYDIFEVINSKTDENKVTWHQVVLNERFISKKEKKLGWTPEEKSFWVKNKLLTWVYPGDLANINITKPLKLNAEEIQFTGIKASTSPKNILYEVIYEIISEHIEKTMGWVREADGIRRADKNIDEMFDLLRNLRNTLWPIKI